MQTGASCYTPSQVCKTSHKQIIQIMQRMQLREHTNKLYERRIFKKIQYITACASVSRDSKHDNSTAQTVKQR